jgi:hypothetical protein
LKRGLQSQTATEHALAEMAPAADVEVIELGPRPSGPRFGTLVHAVLATVPLDTGAEGIKAAAQLQGRIFGATRFYISAPSVSQQKRSSNSTVLKH